jgi:Ni/Co efflux regulator RcnB
MKKRLVTAIAALVTVAAAFAAPFTEAEFHRLHAELQPPTEEAWRSIPWKTSLLDAQATAAREAKPIFIWAMDGHPLGCV